MKSYCSNSPSSLKVASLDIETNNLLEPMIDFSKGFPLTLKDSAKLWVISVHDLQTDKVESIKHIDKNHTRAWLTKTLSSYDVILTHNGIKFDLPALRLFGVLDYEISYEGDDKLFGKDVLFIDTIILSRFENPDRPKGHSLKSWGKKVKLDKIDYRQHCINMGIIPHYAPIGAEFEKFNPAMVEYCETDTRVTSRTYQYLLNRLTTKYEDTDYQRPLRIEHKLADLGIRRELFGFSFDEDKAIECLNELEGLITEIREEVNPYLPLKPLVQSELNEYTPPAKQLTIKNELTTHMRNFLTRHNLEAQIDLTEGVNYFFEYKGKRYDIPYTEPLETHREGDISDLDHVKNYLLDNGWVPVEWGLTDLTKASDKKAISLEKRVERLKRYLESTYKGKYREQRTAELNITNTKEGFNKFYKESIPKLSLKTPFIVPTSPKIKVGVIKELCPNLEKLKQKLPFVSKYADYLSYRHRRSVIASKTFNPEDYPDETPEKGLLNSIREDGRISTPSIEIGAISHRYRHITVANIPRASSLYGKEMRSLFKAGDDYLQLGFDFSSLENRVQGGYVKSYPGGHEYAESLEAEKPNDAHTLNSIKLGISRSDAKSFTYAVLYGAYINKLMKMLGKSYEETEAIYNQFWNNVPALKKFKEDLEKQWKNYDKKYILGIDGRHILVRSAHSILNSCFQSAGVICAKYTTVRLFQLLERQGIKVNPFIEIPDVISMIEYHDENQLAIKKDRSIVEFKLFNTEEEALAFKREKEAETGLQLSSVKKAHKSDRYFVALPSVVSIAIQEATEWVEETLNLQFELGFEYDIGKNWYETH